MSTTNDGGRDENRIELSETFQKSAEIVNFEPSQNFEPPVMMAPDFQAAPAEEPSGD